jgi:hypothetical protein
MAAGLAAATFLEKNSTNIEHFFDICLKSLSIIGFVSLVIIK